MPRVTQSWGESWDLQLGNAALGALPLLLSDAVAPPGQVGSLHPPSSINRVLAACRPQRFITVICIGHCEIRKSSSGPTQTRALLGQAGTGIPGPCPSARWHRARGGSPPQTLRRGDSPAVLVWEELVVSQHLHPWLA